MDYYLSCCCLCGDHRLLIVFEMRSQMRRTFNIYHRGVPCNPLWLTLEVVPLGWNGSRPILLVLKTEEKNKFCKYLTLKEQRDATANGCQNSWGFWSKALEKQNEDAVIIHFFILPQKILQKTNLLLYTGNLSILGSQKPLSPSPSAENE